MDMLPVEPVDLSGGECLAMGTDVCNESAADALAFVVHAPAAPMEQFSRAAAALAAAGEPTMEVLAIAERHGIEPLGPVPATA
jgi:hypothetical protein